MWIDEILKQLAIKDKLIVLFDYNYNIKSIIYIPHRHLALKHSVYVWMQVLRDVFQYKPVLTKQQFLQCGFSQSKIAVICDIINLVLQRHKQLKKEKVCVFLFSLSLKKGIILFLIS